MKKSFILMILIFLFVRDTSFSQDLNKEIELLNISQQLTITAKILFILVEDMKSIEIDLAKVDTLDSREELSLQNIASASMEAGLTSFYEGELLTSLNGVKNDSKLGALTNQKLRLESWSRKNLKRNQERINLSSANTKNAAYLHVADKAKYEVRKSLDLIDDSIRILQWLIGTY